jgi:hypothetical protein
MEALTFGNLRPEDDFMHEIGSDPSHNESMFFNFFDAEKKTGGFVRIGNRANEGHAELTFCVFLADGSVLMQWGRIPLEDKMALRAAGLSFEVVEPARKFAVEYRGQAVRIADPYELADPGKAMRNNPKVDVHLQLDVAGVGPMIGDREGNSKDAVIFLDGVGHYQQAIHASGHIEIGSDRIQLSARGVRDHSWGPRIWHSIARDRSLWISFGPQLTIIACKTWLTGAEDADQMGCLIENGKVTPLKDIVIKTSFKPDTYYHNAVELDLTDVNDRRLHLDGEVLSYAPLRHRKKGEETVYLGQAMTRFTMKGKSSLGLSEYFDAQSRTPGLIEYSKSGAACIE